MPYPASVPPPPQQLYAQSQPPRPQPTPAYQPPYPPVLPAAGIPRPNGSGTINLYEVRPSNSGSVNLSHPLPMQQSYYAPAPQSVYQSRRSRSRSPRRSVIDQSRNGQNTYRTDRRLDQPGSYIRDSSPRVRDSPDTRFSPLTGRRVSGPATSSNSNSVTQTIAIEASSVGLVIGRQGENMRRLEASTRTRIQFAPASETEDGMRKCTITGSREAIEDAISEIQRIMDEHDKPSKGSSGRVPPPTGRNLAEDHPTNGQRESQPGKDGNSVTIMVPSKTVGLIIGKRGESIKDIQDRSHCHVNIMPEDQNVNGFRPVHLLGTPHQAAVARDIIMDIVHTDAKALPHEAPPGRDTGRSMPTSSSRGGNDKNTINISVPSEAVGMIIGKGGEAVRDMQEITNCKINVSQPSGRDIEREIELIGTKSAIQQAEAAIMEKVRAVVRPVSGYLNFTLTWHSRRRMLV